MKFLDEFHDIYTRGEFRYNFKEMILMGSYCDNRVFVSKHGPDIRKTLNSFIVKGRKFTTKYAESGILPTPFWGLSVNIPGSNKFVVHAGCAGLEKRAHQMINNVEVAFDKENMPMDIPNADICFMTESLWRQNDIHINGLGDVKCGYPENIIKLFTTAWNNPMLDEDGPGQRMLQAPSVVFPGNIKHIINGTESRTFAPLNFVTFLIGRAEKEEYHNEGAFAMRLIFSHYEIPKGFNQLAPDKLEDLSFELFKKDYCALDPEV
jgi:hypothetical protein